LNFIKKRGASPEIIKAFREAVSKGALSSLSRRRSGEVISDLL